MKELLKLEVVEGLNSVNARSLWTFLESKQEFANWIKNKISKCRFIENIDYKLLDKKIKQVSGTKTLKEYHISIDMAKMLGMLENNEKGDEVRRYFIECEKQLKQVVLSPAEILIQQGQMMLKIEQEQKRLDQEQKLIQDKQKETDSRLEIVEANLDEKYFTVKGYCSLIGKNTTLAEANKIGRNCTCLSKSEGVEIGRVKDTRFGHINSYHKDILDIIVVQ